MNPCAPRSHVAYPERTPGTPVDLVATAKSLLIPITIQTVDLAVLSDSRTVPVCAIASVKVIESFARRQDAEEFVEEVQRDDAELAELPRLERRSVGRG